MTVRHFSRAALVLCGALALAASVTPAAEQDGEGVTYLGTGFTGRPFLLAGDVVLETDGVWSCLRDYGAAELPGWIAWHHAGATGGEWREVLVEDELVVALRDGFDAGAQFVDFTDPAEPVILGAISGPSYASGFLRQRILYLALESLIIAYDVSDPANPAFRFATNLPAHAEPRGFCSTGDVVYFIETGATVHALGVADPLAIQDLGTFTLDADRVDALATSPGTLHALVATETAPDAYRVELVAFDLTDPLAPVETDRRELAVGLGARGLQLRCRDQLLLASENQASTHAFDVSVPTLPQPGYTLPVAAERLVVTDSRVLILACDALRVHARTAASEPPTLLSLRRVLPRLRRLTGTGPVLVAQPEKDHSLLIAVDASDPAHPRLTSEFETGLDGDLVHHDRVAVMVAGDDLQVVDMADPGAPVLGGALRLTSRVSGVGGVLAPGILALEAHATEAVVLVDLADPDAPVQAARLEDASFPLAVGGGVLLVAANDQALILDVHDPHAPMDHGPLPLSGTPLSAAIAGPRAYCLTEGAGIHRLEVVDISDPADATVIATQTLDQAGRLAVHGQRLLVVGSSRVLILDIAQPGPPAVVAWLAPAFSAVSRVATNDDLIITGTNLVVARDDTWRPVPVAIPAAPGSRLVSIHPNPFNPRTTITFHLAVSRHVTLAVHDLRGRRLATLASNAMPAGAHQLAWSGTDDAGRPLPSGVYLVRLSSPGLESSRPVTLLK